MPVPAVFAVLVPVNTAVFAFSSPANAPALDSDEEVTDAISAVQLLKVSVTPAKPSPIAIARKAADAGGRALGNEVQPGNAAVIEGVAVGAARTHNLPDEARRAAHAAAGILQRTADHLTVIEGLRAVVGETDDRTYRVALRADHGVLNGQIRQGKAALVELADNAADLPVGAFNHTVFHRASVDGGIPLTGNAAQEVAAGNGAVFDRAVCDFTGVSHTDQTASVGIPGRLTDYSHAIHRNAGNRGTGRIARQHAGFAFRCFHGARP